MNIRIVEPIRGGVVRAIASKSAAHRLLICAALAREGETYLRCPERSEDIEATRRCLEGMGAGLRYERDGFSITPIFAARPALTATDDQDAGRERVLDCGESGSTLRFLLPVCGALGLSASFLMGGGLPSRPLSGLYEEMAAHGCALSAPGASTLTSRGRLESGTYSLPGNISSQFVSGLLFALPLLAGDSLIRLTSPLESRPYVDMTQEALGLFGVTVQEDEGRFRVPGGQYYRSPGTVQAEGDWSNAAFWLSAGAIGTGAITCTGLKEDSRQGDRAIVELLARFGARVSLAPGAVTVFPGPLRGLVIDAGDTPDLVPVLAAVASVAEGETVIRNALRLRIKESDRLRTVSESLSSLGANIRETEDGLIIRGQKALPGGETRSFGDHRIAMAAATLSTACSGPVVIREAEAVRKSYPGFFEDFSACLGGLCAE